MIEDLSEYYRTPEGFLHDIPVAMQSGNEGFFRLRSGAVGYGPCATGVSLNFEEAPLCRALANQLPWDPPRTIKNLRHERYEKSLTPAREKTLSQEWSLKAYYFVRDSLPTSARQCLQRIYFSDWKKRPFPAWPVDFTVDAIHERLLQLSMEAAGLRRVPFIWFWPEGAANCLILTHDVETCAGRAFTFQLMDLDESRHLRASFQVIPEKRYEVPPEYVREIRNRGFEFNIHDLNHDGRLYRDRDEFLRRAKKINGYIHLYGAKGFRAGVMYRNLDWYDAYEFSYDMSMPNVAHLDATHGGCCTVFPFFVGRILELPLTTSQDYSLFYILKDYSIDLWKKQLDVIRRKNGLMSFLAHPDYLICLRNRRVYQHLLDYLFEMVSQENVWHALPGEVDRWWRTRSQLRLIKRRGEWEIEGQGKERARIAYAVLDGNRLVYEVASHGAPALHGYGFSTSPAPPA
ncbi:MAG TPA: hypothetical protein VJN92_05115 [Candidatus Acidoferrum sp.]|nr:hypothetical protein [Candidatus Acidoferrum sp.]